MATSQDRRGPGPERTRFAALDLGTNNCRLLVAAPRGRSYRVVGGFSRIVRLGEGLAATGRLSDAAMARALSALRVCAARVEEHRPCRFEAVATQACRAAANGADFLSRVHAETGLRLRVIDAEEEARLAALGCLDLIDPAAKVALIVDVGGGSTEFSFVDAGSVAPGREPTLLGWASAPIGVVTLAEQHPEPDAGLQDWFESLVAAALAGFASGGVGDAFDAAFARGEGQIIGASGAVTSLAGVRLGLKRYRRADVDGVWLTAGACASAAQSVLGMSLGERRAHPCIGADRADLVTPGAAIMEAVLRRWPVARVRVADRGLREGLLWRMAHAHGQASAP